jgi:hypothetical protein
MSGMRPGVPGMYPGRMNGQGMHPGMGMMGNATYPTGQSDTPSMSPRTDKTNISKSRLHHFEFSEGTGAFPDCERADTSFYS